MRHYYLLLLILLLFPLRAQDRPSIHAEQQAFYSAHPELAGKDSPAGTQFRKQPASPAALSKVVYGFHPYWISDATASTYSYSLLSHIVYFSAEVDTGVATTGGFLTTRNWATTQVVNYAKTAGIKIHLCITMFAKHSRILNSTTNRQNLINNILTQVNLRSADGANIDFEGVSSTVADSFKTFIFQLGTALKAAGKELVVELPAVDWSSVYTSAFFTGTSSVVDYYFLMAYDYYYSGSTTAGPVAPVTTGTSIYHCTRSIRSYLTAGAGSSKLIAGFPYYGYEWPVASSARMATASGNGSAKLYSAIAPIIDTISASNSFFDATYNVPWYRRQNGSQWYQTWYDDSLSLAKKYDSVKSLGIAGTGMWALSYDGSRSELWGALQNAFQVAAPTTKTVLADFESSVGLFDKAPTFSGSTVGIAAGSTASRTTTTANSGIGSLQVYLTDNATVTTNWIVRLLSGGGAVASNTALKINGYIGFWMKTSTGTASSQVAITLDDAAGGTELSSKQNVVSDGSWKLYQWALPGTGWASFASSNGIIDGPTVTLDAIMLYNNNASPDWTVYIDDVTYDSVAALPVELTHFSLAASGRKVTLTWATATEVNTYGFYIQRRAAGLNEWQTLGMVRARGNSNTTSEYSFSDVPGENKRYVYRLKIVDLDGSEAHSMMQSVDFETPSGYSLRQNYPNPFNPETRIDFTVPVTDKISIAVYNLLGEKLETLADRVYTEGHHTLQFNGSSLPSGVYLCRMTSSSGYTASIKMMLQK